MTAQTAIASPAPHAALGFATPVLGYRSPSLLARLAQTVGLWQQRRQLAALDDRALADIGVSRGQALAEAARPVWDVPATWRR